MIDYDIKNITNLPLKAQLLVSSIFFFVILYFGYLWDFSALNRQIASGKQQEQDLKIQVEALIDDLADLNDEISQLPKLKEMLQTWQAKLVKPSELPDLLNEILKVGTNNQLQFDLFNPGAEVKEDLYYQVPIKTIVTGDYNQIASFLSQVANMPWIVVIDNFVINKGQNKLYEKKIAEQPGYANRLTAEITLEVYHLAEK